MGEKNTYEPLYDDDDCEGKKKAEAKKSKLSFSSQKSKLPRIFISCFCIILFAAIIGLLIAILVIICQIKDGMVTLGEIIASPVLVQRGVNLQQQQQLDVTDTLQAYEYLFKNDTLSVIWAIYMNQNCILTCYS